jgi:hypothetical protein
MQPKKIAGLLNTLVFAGLQKQKKRELEMTDNNKLWQYKLKSRNRISEEHESTLINFSPDYEIEDTQSQE